MTIKKTTNTTIKTLIKTYAEPNRKNIAKRQEIFNDLATQDSDGEHCTRLNFKNSKHLNSLISSDAAFWNKYMDLLSLLKQNKNKFPREIYKKL